MNDIVQNKPVFEAFRVKYPEFSYDSYSWERRGLALILSFKYSFSEGDSIVTNVDVILPEEITDEEIKNNEDYIFRIGIINALSYWKAHSSPNFHIKCGSLTLAEISWWKSVWYEGVGEFRYRNGLMEVSKNDWVKFVCDIAEENSKHNFGKLNGNLIGFTGGKDSTLTLGLIKDSNEKDNEIFTIHKPTENLQKIREVLGVSDWKETVVIRNIDEELLIKNKDGALNGHTPFSIIIGFVGLFVASLRGKEYLIVSNESSANEPTVPGTDINHQYSKSLQFEKSFQEYINTVWPNGPKYFSILRPLGEVGIISLLSKYENAMPYITSCNTVKREKLWCSTCPKCLFSFLMFSAVWDIKFATKIFEVNMFEDSGNMNTLLELTGLTLNKPFECVGTTVECLAALAVVYEKQGSKDEVLLKAFYDTHKEILPAPETFKKLVCEFNENSMPDKFATIIRDAQAGICHE
jgi:uncharacterized protein YktA (UPF0223 family)